jgi:hypothetical protein
MEVYGGEMSSAERQDTAESAQRPCLLAALNLIGCRTLKSCNLAAALRSESQSRPNPKFFHSPLPFLFDVSLYSISTFIMRFSNSVLLAASSLLGAALAHNIQLKAHGRECFHEMLHKDDKMTVTFQVGDREFGSAGSLDVDFWVCWMEPPFRCTY